MNNNRFPTGIKTLVNQDYSYANSVIQSLGNLDCIKQLINIQNLQYLKNNPDPSLTKEFFTLLFIINNVNKEPIIDDFIVSFKQAYNKNQSIIISKNVLSPDPFHFLYFLLQFIHLEINQCNDKNYDINNYNNQNINNQKNDDYMLLLFLDFYSKTQNSVISNIFFNTIRNIYNCRFCGDYYFYSMVTIIRINVESAFFYRNNLNPNKNGTNLNIYDILNFFCDKDKVNCKFCNNSAEKITEMFNPAKVLIFAFERNNHNFKNDIDFDEKININNYISKKVFDNKIQFNSNYTLKSCISYSNQINKYFADCYVNGIWVRFMDSKVEQLVSKNNLFEYEPQMLIYEQIEENNVSNPQFLNDTVFSDQFNIQNNQNNNNQINLPSNQFDIDNQSVNNINNSFMNFLQKIVGDNNNPQFQNINNPQYQNNYNPQFQNINNPQFQNINNLQFQNYYP